MSAVATHEHDLSSWFERGPGCWGVRRAELDVFEAGSGTDEACEVG